MTLRFTDIFSKHQPSMPLPFMSEERLERGKKVVSQGFSPPCLEMWARVLISQGIFFLNVSVLKKEKKIFALYTCKANPLYGASKQSTSQ